MYVATLISDPKRANLTAEIASSATVMLGGKGVKWLCENVACDIELDTKPADFESVWQALQERKIDLVIQPAAGRRKKVLLADMDSTMIEQECIDELAAEAGVGEEVAVITARAMNGELEFNEALLERVRLLKGLPVGMIAHVLKTRITLMPGGLELLATMKRNGAYCALVSGGFVDFTSAIAERLGFDENRANTLLQEAGRLSGKPGLPILGREAKVQALNDIVARRDLQTTDVIAVGDGANDLGMLQLAGCGVALHAKPVVAAQTNVRLNFADLTGLLYLQGYAQDEIIAS
ncbi:MAG: phosphoserine phosphatase SerB [Rhodobacteraceae bacterium]|nr:phosphoserine phosphatase SerB [Paracoccaceae bacterium]